MTTMPLGARTTSPRCGAGASPATPSTMSSAPRPAARATADAAAMLARLAAPSRRVSIARTSPRSDSVRRRAVESARADPGDRDVGWHIHAERDHLPGESRTHGQSRAGRQHWRRRPDRRSRPPGSPAWPSRSRRPTRRSRGAPRRRWSTPAPAARQSRPGGGSRPTPLIPSSTTANSGAVCSSNSDSGRPRWLFRLPRLRNVVNRRASSVAEISLVVVLPALPVMATTVDDARRRMTRAASCRPRSVSSTTITGTPAAVTVDASLTTTAPAPRAMASATKACPSKRGPRMATNRSPGAIVRVSIETVGSGRSAGPTCEVATERGRHLDGREGERRRAHRAPP